MKIYLFVIFTLLNVIFANAQVKNDSLVTDTLKPKYYYNAIYAHTMVGTYRSKGVGISYERFSKKDSSTSLVIGIQHFLDSNTDYLEFLNEENNALLNMKIPMTYFSPGLRIYPKPLKRFNYAIGMLLPVGYGKNKQGTRFNFGCYLNNHFSIRIFKRLRMGFDIDTGVVYKEVFKTSVKSYRSLYQETFDIQLNLSTSLGFHF